MGDALAGLELLLNAPDKEVGEQRALSSRSNPLINRRARINTVEQYSSPLSLTAFFVIFPSVLPFIRETDGVKSHG